MWLWTKLMVKNWTWLSAHFINSTAFWKPVVFLSPGTCYEIQNLFYKVPWQSCSQTNRIVWCMCVCASYMKLMRDTHLMQQFIYYYKQLYMFRASICPSSGVLGCIRIYYSIWCPAYRCPKHVELFIIIYKLLHQVGISRQFQQDRFSVSSSVPENGSRTTSETVIVINSDEGRSTK